MMRSHRPRRVGPLEHPESCLANNGSDSGGSVGAVCELDLVGRGKIVFLEENTAGEAPAIKKFLLERKGTNYNRLIQLIITS
jgi:hypothetical protein